MKQFNATRWAFNSIKYGPKYYTDMAAAELMTSNLKTYTTSFFGGFGVIDSDQAKNMRADADNNLVNSYVYTLESYLIRPFAIIMLPVAIAFDIIAAPCIALKNFFAPEPQVRYSSTVNTPLDEFARQASVQFSGLGSFFDLGSFFEPHRQRMTPQFNSSTAHGGNRFNTGPTRNQEATHVSNIRCVN